MTHNLYRFPYWPFNVIKLINFFLDFFSGSCRKRTTSRYCCIFPFIYKGRRYNRCTRKNHNRPWCAITPNYDRDRKWGNCAGKSGFFCFCFVFVFLFFFWGGEGLVRTIVSRFGVPVAVFDVIGPETGFMWRDFRIWIRSKTHWSCSDSTKPFSTTFGFM